MPILLLAACLIFAEDSATGLMTSGGVISPNQEAIDIKALRLVLTVQPDQKTVDGFAEISVLLRRPNQQVIELELVPSLQIYEVFVDGQAVTPRREDFHLFIPISKSAGSDKVQVRIAYGGSPQEALQPPWSGGFNWSRNDSGMPWVGVSCQSQGGKVWFPCKTHPSDKIESLKLEITVPDSLYCAANGILEKAVPAGTGWRTFHWKSRYPISTYNVSINIADYQVIERRFPGEKPFPVVFYVLKEYQREDQDANDPRSYDQKKEDLMEETLKYLAFYSKFYGEFPFSDEKFGIAHSHYLGMEHQTINSYGNHFKIQDGYDWLLLHEMSHEWWGNKVAVADWGDIWIHEGIGTYTTGVYLEHAFDVEKALAFFRNLKRLVANRQPLFPGRNVDSAKAYTPDIYNKGALVLHTLRFLIGKEMLDGILKEFAIDANNTYNNFASTTEFMALAQRRSGKDLDWFFQRYFFQSELPRLEVQDRQDGLRLAWDDPLFEMPVEIGFGEGRDLSFRRIEMPAGSAVVEKDGDRPFRVDPRGWVLKEIVGETKHDHSGR